MKDQLQVISSIIMHRDISQRPPAIVAVLTAGLALGFKDNDFFVTPSYILAKLYTNNLLVIFNSRLHIEHGRNGRPAEDSGYASFANSSYSAATSIGSRFQVASRVPNNVQNDDNFIALKGTGNA
jgi:hypothetical protein